MTLARRIKKLQSQGRQVTINKYYLFDMGGYNAPESVMKLCTGVGILMVLGFFIFWSVSWVLIDQKNSSNPELIQLNIDKKNQESAQLQLEKQKYVDSCRSAGKAPTDMSDSKQAWVCR